MIGGGGGQQKNIYVASPTECLSRRNLHIINYFANDFKKIT